MKTRYLMALVLGLAAVAAAINCAPVDPAAEEARNAQTARRGPEQPPPDEAPLLTPELLKTQQPGQPVAAPDPIKQRIDAAIAQVRRRKLRTDNGFWTVFHYILGLGPSVKLYNPETKEDVNALDYIAAGGKMPGVSFIPTPDGLDVETGPGTFTKQGHQDQFVAEMVEWNVSPDRKFVVGGKSYIFQDFLRHSKARASLKNPELEWAIVIISSYYGTDLTWINAAGEKLHFEDLIRAELDKDVDKAACGGTHLLFGLSWSYHIHLRHGGQSVGVWKEIADKTALYKKKARETQNPDGALSTDWFKGRANNPDVGERIRTTGHMLEWLALALTDEELREPWVQSAASALAMMLLENQHQGLDGGSMYHAVHGLLLYSSRVYGADKLGESAPHAPLPLAKKG
ncbi:MAG TPA: hypothetical protein VKA46_01245 [Gemmataceae bacterium]|nr:hypothetical protein [Gemmataceae bacterium]